MDDAEATRAALVAVRDRYLDLTIREVMTMPEGVFRLCCMALIRQDPNLAVAMARELLEEVQP